MRYLDEYRDPGHAARLMDAIRRRANRCWTIMEVCGGQTHGLLKNGIDAALQGVIEFLHGPGCPVCVTPLDRIDRAIELASRPEVTLCTFGDMARVPGSRDSLLTARARGSDVKIVYSPLDAVRIAAERPHRQVVFFAVGFETTAPASALAVRQARAMGLENFSMLVAHVLVPPALEAVFGDPHCRVDGLLAAGHVCTITGLAAYAKLAQRYRIPITVAGFEPIDLLEAIYRTVDQLESGTYHVENAYCRVAPPQGNPAARNAVEAVFEICDMAWRGLGVLPQSGLRLNDDFRAFDADRYFPARSISLAISEDCKAGEVLQGRLRPDQCPEFNRRCTPESPLGAPMVSSEGACAAYFAFRRHGAK